MRTVLELGSGGGHNAVHLAPSFTLTLTDLSPSMIEVSQRLNPGCEHVVGDMRTLRLDRQFDAVFVHDAVEYMVTVEDLRRAMETAYVHCRPGGAAVFIPDAVTETFAPGADHGGEDGSDGRAVRFLEWTTDPDPDDTWTQTDYVFLLRAAGGSIDVVHEEHRTGLYREAVWMDLLRDVGFDPEVVIEATTEDRTPRHCFWHIDLESASAAEAPPRGRGSPRGRRGR